MSGSENPLFRSVGAWSFSVALKRAQAYYPRRLAVEAPADGSGGRAGALGAAQAVLRLRRRRGGARIRP
ncbi:MAG: hypothetical protein ACLSVD_00890 [Eggerthellaceae bacterium]